MKTCSGWAEVAFRYKPGDVERPPPSLVAPHQPRLDWQMWFAALSPNAPNWLVRLADLVLASDDLLSDTATGGGGGGGTTLGELLGPQPALAAAAAECGLSPSSHDGSGAAALVIGSESWCNKRGGAKVWIEGSALRSCRPSPWSRRGRCSSETCSSHDPLFVVLTVRRRPSDENGHLC